MSLTEKASFIKRVFNKEVPLRVCVVKCVICSHYGPVLSSVVLSAFSVSSIVSFFLYGWLRLLHLLVCAVCAFVLGAFLLLLSVRLS